MTTDTPRAGYVDMPTLTGTEKQIAWAREIRYVMTPRIAEIASLAIGRLIGEARPGLADIVIAARDEIVGRSRADWWIDGRPKHPGSEADRAAGMLKDALPDGLAAADRAALEDAIDGWYPTD